MSVQNSSAPLTPQRIMQMAWSFAIPLTLEAAVKHRVFDVLSERPPENTALNGSLLLFEMYPTKRS